MCMLPLQAMCYSLVRIEITNARIVWSGCITRKCRPVYRYMDKKTIHCFKWKRAHLSGESAIRMYISGAELHKSGKRWKTHPFSNERPHTLSVFGLCVFFNLLEVRLLFNIVIFRIKYRRRSRKFVQCGRTPFCRKYASLKKSWMYLINIYVGIFIFFPI